MPTASSHYHLRQPEDRVTIASLRQQNHSVRAIARQLRRSPATFSRELQRNACSSGYDSAHAPCLFPAAQALRQASDEAAFRVDLVRPGNPSAAAALVARADCPDTLARLYPPGHEYRVSHETIYNCIFAMPVGELRKELIATLRHAHNKRLPR